LGLFQLVFNSTEELADWQMQAYQIIFNRTGEGKELHEVDMTDAEGRAFVVEKDIRGLLEDLHFESVAFPVTVKLTFQDPLWQYVPEGGVPIAMALWKKPRLDSEPSESWITKGETFQVSQRARGEDGVVYLQLANGRGWAVEQKPGESAQCVRKDAWRKEGPLLSAGPKDFPAHVAGGSWVYAEDTPRKPGWISRPGKAGGQISFDVETRVGEVIVEYLATYTNIGTATCSVDGGPSILLDGRIDEQVSVGEFRKIEAPAGGAHKLTCISDGRKFKLLSVLSC
jgi:hypothetical protein